MFHTTAFNQGNFSQNSLAFHNEADCTSQDWEQTLFLGCSIEGFSCQLGWGEQSSELTVNLIRDECENFKTYYDITDSEPRQREFMADPGFNIYGDNEDEPPRLGSPVYFRFAKFEFCGLLQSWQRLQPSSDKERYEVKILGPTALLEGVNVIIGDYVGEVNGFNIINAYGFQEDAAGSTCTYYNDATDGPIFGSIAGGFGGSDRTEAGMPAAKILQSINFLTSALPASNTLGYGDYSQFGRVVYHGANTNAAYGLIPHDDESVLIESLWGLESNIAYFMLDLSDLPVPPSDYRIPGTSIDLLAFITQICSDFGHDYYLEIVPVLINEVLFKTIKVRTVSRLTQPTLGRVASFVTASEISGGVVSSNYGQELRNESNSTFLIGGNKRSIWEVYNGYPSSDPDETFFTNNYGTNVYVRDRIVPFFGFNSTGNPNVLYEDTGAEGTSRYYVDMDFTVLAPKLNTLGAYLSGHQVTIGELQAASAGYDSWISHSKNINSDIYEQLNTNGVGISSIWGTISNLTNQNPNKLISRDFIDTIGAASNIDASIKEDLVTIQEYLGDIYDTSRTTFMTRLPYTCVTATNGKIKTTDLPADGGWTEKSTLLGLANPGGALDYFKNQDGSIAPIAVFSGSGISSTNLSASKYYYPTNDLLYLQTTVDPNLVFLDNYNKVSPRVLVTIPEVEEIVNQFRFSNAYVNTTTAVNNALVGADGVMTKASGLISGDLERDLLNFGLMPDIIEPFGLAVPMKSNVHTYGPWKPSNAIEAGPPGRIVVRKDDTLVPWTYGSLSAMSTVAQAECNASVTAMVYGENGNVTVPGYPTVPLGAEITCLQGLGSSFYSSEEHLIENRSIAVASTILGGQTFNFQYIAYGEWTGEYGPNITSIGINVSSQGTNTTYTFRTFSPKFGHLAKMNAERIAKRTQQLNFVRGQSRMNNFLQDIQNRNAANTKVVFKKLDRLHKNNDRQSSSESIGAIQGESVNISVNGQRARRHVVNAQKVTQLGNTAAANSGYNTRAVMSWDGLIRPVSLFGDGSLPRLSTNRFEGCGHTIAGYADYINHFILDIDEDETPQLASGIGISRFSSISMQSAPYRFWSSTGEIEKTIPAIGSLHLNPLSNPYPSGNAIINSGNIPAFKDLVYTGNNGHDIDLVARNQFSQLGSGIDQTSSLSVYSSKNIDSKDYSKDYRFFALRGPIMMQGWGYDLDGKPIPNANDKEEWLSSGVYRVDNLSDKFYSGYLTDSNTWPVAPVDLRFDRFRNVWTTSNECSPLDLWTDSGIMASGDVNNISPYDAIFLKIPTATNNFASYDITGGVLSDPYVKVENPYSTITNPFGERIYAVPIPRYSIDNSIDDTIARHADYLLLGQDQSLSIWHESQIDDGLENNPITKGVREIVLSSGFSIDYKPRNGDGITSSAQVDTWNYIPFIDINLGSGLARGPSGDIIIDSNYVFNDIDISGELIVARAGTDLDVNTFTGPAVITDINFNSSFITQLDGDGDLVVQAGLYVEDSAGNVTRQNDPTVDHRYYQVNFGDGCIVNEVNDWSMELGAGVSVNTLGTTAVGARHVENEPANSDFNLADLSEGPLFNTLYMGRGINVKPNTTAGRLEVGGGVHFIDTTNTLIIHDDSSVDSAQFYPLINIGKGLSFEATPGATDERLNLGLNLRIDNVQSTNITIGSGLHFVSGAEGNVEIHATSSGGGNASKFDFMLGWTQAFTAASWNNSTRIKSNGLGTGYLVSSNGSEGSTQEIYNPYAYSINPPTGYAYIGRGTIVDGQYVMDTIDLCHPVVWSAP